MADEIITQYLIPSSNAIPTVSDPHAPVGSFLRRDVLLHPFVEKDTVIVDGQERERVIIRMLPDYMTNPYVHKFVMYMVAVATIQCSWVQKGSVLEAGDGADNDQFGYAVALASNVLVVGANNWEGASGSNIGGVYIFDWTGVSWVQRGSVLYPAAGQNGDGFGTSVALTSDASVLIVGAGNFVNSTVGFRTGGVYTFDWSGSSWVQRGSVLTAIDWGLNDYFGASVAVSDDGNILVVGASSWGGSVNTSGCVYTFDRSGSSWIQRGSVLEASDKQESDLFGSSVSLSSDGTVLAVGAQFWEGSEGTNTGGVYIYDWSGSAWVQRGSVLELNSTDFQITEEFGSSVALSSNASVLAVGASGRNSDQGDVHIYDWSGSSWIKRGTALVASDAANSDYFGASVALSSNAKSLVVGAYKWEGTLGSNRGGIYFYNWICNGCAQDFDWTEPGYLGLTSTWGLNIVSISADGTTAIIGSPYYESSRGRALILEKQFGDWLPVSTIYPPAGSNQFFGRSVVIAGNGKVAFIGSPGSASNTVQVIRKNVDNTWSLSTILTASDYSTPILFGECVSTDYSGNLLAVSAPYQSGSVYVFTYSSNSWTETKKITASFTTTTLTNFGFCVKVSADGRTIAISAPGYSPTLTNSGRVSVYEYDRYGTDKWPFKANIDPSTPKTQGKFGYSLDLSATGDYLAICELELVSSPSTYRTTAWYYAKFSSTNYFVRDFVTSENFQSQYVGYRNESVALSKDYKKLYLGVGYYRDSQDNEIGAVYKYTDADGYWTDQYFQEDQKLLASTPTYYGKFGASVSTSYFGCTTIIAGMKNTSPATYYYHIFSCPCEEPGAIEIEYTTAISYDSTPTFREISGVFPLGYTGEIQQFTPLYYEYFSNYDYYINGTKGDYFYEYPQMSVGDHFTVYWGALFDAPVPTGIPNNSDTGFYLSINFSNSAPFGLEIEFDTKSDFIACMVDNEIILKFEHKTDPTKTYEFGLSFPGFMPTVDGNYVHATAPITKIRNIQGNIISLAQYNEHPEKWQII